MVRFEEIREDVRVIALQILNRNEDLGDFIESQLLKPPSKFKQPLLDVKATQPHRRILRAVLSIELEKEP